MGFCKSGLMGVKMKNQLQQIGCLRIPLYLPLKPFHQKTHACCFSLSGVITHIRQELMSALSKRVINCACVRPKLLKQKKSSTDRAVILFGREIISMLCVLWQCCQPRFLLILLKNDILYKSDKIYQKMKKKKKTRLQVLWNR